MSQQPYPKLIRLRENGAGRSSVSYLALHPMGFSVPLRLRSARWSLTPPFHPYCPTRNSKCETRKQFRAPRSEFHVGKRFNFLWHCPSKRFRVSPACIQPTRNSKCGSRKKFRDPRSEFRVGRLRGIVPCGVRTFLLRLAPKAILRSSKISVKVTFLCGYARSQTCENLVIQRDQCR